MSAADVEMRPEERTTQAARDDATSGRKGRLALLALILLLLITCCCLGWSQLREIPDVVGMTEEEAREVLEEAGFEVAVAESAGQTTGDDATGTPGTVLTQSPGAGKRHVVGTTVTITLAPDTAASGDGDGSQSDDGSAGTDGSGSPSTALPPADDGGSGGTGDWSISGSGGGGPTVPVAQNLTEAAARRVLEGAGYRMVVGGYGPTSAGIVEGNVYFQDPAPGTILSRGATITVWISTGAPHTDGYEGVPYPGPTNP